MSECSGNCSSCGESCADRKPERRQRGAKLLIGGYDFRIAFGGTASGSRGCAPQGGEEDNQHYHGKQ